jgi:hypothetical protein
MLLKVIRGATEYAGDFRIIGLGSEATAFFLYFGNGLSAVRHDAERLERPDAGNY